jgi:hypothetical protein
MFEHVLNHMLVSHICEFYYMLLALLSKPPMICSDIVLSGSMRKISGNDNCIFLQFEIIIFNTFFFLVIFNLN